MMRLRKLAQISIVGMALGGLLAACGGNAGSPASNGTVTVKVQTYPGIWTNALVWVGQEKGFYKEHGLNVQSVEIGTGPQGLAALQSGSIQLSQNTTDNLVVTASKGVKLQAVVGNFGDMYTLMVAKDVPVSGQYPDNATALEGRKIGITAPGASTDMLARTTVVDGGLPEDSAQYVAVGGTAGQVTALNSGVVDAVVAMTPQNAVFEATGQAKPVVSYAKGEGPAIIQKLNGCFQTYFGMTDWIEDNAETVEKFAAAHAEAAAWANDPANLDELTEILTSKAPVSGVDDPAAVAKQAAQDMVEAGQLTTEVSGECVSSWSDHLVKSGLIDNPVDGSALVWSGAED